MPIVTIELVADPGRSPAPGLAQRLADAVGRALNSPPGQTWIRLRSYGHDEYAENESHVAVAQMPVLVSVLEQRPPTGTQLETEIAALTLAIARTTGSPESRVHIEYAPAASGRMSFGGRLHR